MRKYKKNQKELQHYTIADCMSYYVMGFISVCNDGQVVKLIKES